jgi:hypothetical protein
MFAPSSGPGDMAAASRQVDPVDRGLADLRLIGLSADIGVGVDATPQSDRIAGRISADRWIVVAASALMQPRLSVEDLTREAQVVNYSRL